MARRRLYVFGGIILVGVLIGIFCLPGRNNAPAPADGSGIVAPAPIGPLPENDINNTPSAKAEALVKKALTLTDVNEKFHTLQQAWQTDPAGRWGEQALAEIGKIPDPKAAQWYAEHKKPDALVPAPAPVAEIKTAPYKVQSGDSLWAIAKRHATTSGAIKTVNKLTSDSIRVGATLNIPKGPFDVHVAKSTHTLQLLQEGKPVRTYTVALGANNSTPPGTFTIENKLVDPVWYSDQGRIPAGDPRNMLGSRWIGFSGQIGIHGSRPAEDATIGTDASKGCVRMHDKDVKELYEFVVEGKSKVTIVD